MNINHTTPAAELLDAGLDRGGVWHGRTMWTAAGPAHWDTMGGSRPTTAPRATPATIEPVSPRSFDTRELAVQWARHRIVPADGSAAVINLDGERPVEEARYLRAVADAHLDPVSRQLGAAPPAGWRSYVQQPSWLTQGWMAISGSFVMLHLPEEVAAITEEWAYEWPPVPGVTDPGRAHLGHVLIIGSDGGPTHLVVDRTAADSPVYALPNVCDSWDEQAVVRAGDIADLMSQLDAGTFTFY